jgi:hypothetical protein
MVGCGGMGGVLWWLRLSLLGGDLGFVRMHPMSMPVIESLHESMWVEEDNILNVPDSGSKTMKHMIALNPLVSALTIEQFHYANSNQNLAGRDVLLV